MLYDVKQGEEAEVYLLEIQSDVLRRTTVGAMGAMASTLAHALNQPLTSIANYVQTSRSILENADQTSIAHAREALAIAGEEVLRAGEILRQLRAFVARGDTKKSIEPVAELITDSCSFGLARARAHGIVSRIDLAPDLGQVFVDYLQIQQVLINLMGNSIEALAPNGCGELRIASRHDGEFVRIIVADSGPGLSLQAGKSLFQPFLSTKPDGMGLGLSICRTIVEAHGGRIWHEAAQGGGAAFQFTIPLAQNGAPHG